MTVRFAMARQTIARLVVSACVAAIVAPVAFGQSMLRHSFRPGYDVGTLVADLQSAGCDVPVNELVDAYVEYTAMWLDARNEARTAVERALPASGGALPGTASAERIIRALKHERTRDMAAESRMFERIVAAAPACSEAIQRVREWRRNRYARSFLGPLPITRQTVDIGEAARLAALDAATRRAIVERLATSETERRVAFERLERATLDAEIAAAGILDSAGLADIDLNEAGDRPPFAYQKALTPDLSAVASYMDAQLRAFRDIEPLLPPMVRRSMLDQDVSGLRLGGGLAESGGLPNVGMHVSRPSDVARLVLAWTDLQPARREATRAAITAWLDETDALFMSMVEAQVTGLRGGTSASELTSVPVDEPTPWETLAATHVPRIAEASGAEWLLTPTGAPPPTDARDYHEDDLALTGSVLAHVARRSADTSSRRADELLPAPLSDIDRQRLLDAVLDDERATAILTALLADHAAGWARDVEPAVAEARAAGATDLYFVDTARLDAELELSTKAHAARVTAFGAADLLDDELYSAAEAIVDADTLARARRARAARNVAGALDRLGNWFGTVSRIDLEGLGGRLFDVAAALDDKEVPPEARRAAEAAVVERWTAIVLLAREVRALQLEHWLVQRQALIERRRGEGHPSPESAEARAVREEREAQLIDRWRQESDGLQAAMLDAVAPIDGAVEAVRHAFRTRQFPSCLNNSISHRSILQMLRELPGFDGQEALERRLAAIGAKLDEYAERSVQTCLPVVRLRGADVAKSTRERQDLAQRRRDLYLASSKLTGAELLLIARTVPPEAMKASDPLRRAVRGYLPTLEP